MRTEKEKKYTSNITYVLLLLYCFALLKPLTPIVKDVVAHAFYKMEHIATVHYENGKYHLHAELAKNEANTSNNTSKENNGSSELDWCSQHINTNGIEINTFSQANGGLFFNSAENFPLSIALSISSPPPEV